LFPIDGVTRRLADGVSAIRPGVPVRPLAEPNTASFRMIWPAVQPQPAREPRIRGDLRL